MVTQATATTSKALAVSAEALSASAFFKGSQNINPIDSPESKIHLSLVDLRIANDKLTTVDFNQAKFSNGILKSAFN